MRGQNKSTTTTTTTTKQQQQKAHHACDILLYVNGTNLVDRSNTYHTKYIVLLYIYAYDQTKNPNKYLSTQPNTKKQERNI